MKSKKKVTINEPQSSGSSEKRLTTNDLTQTQKDKHKQNKKIYKGILADCEKKIKYQNSLGNSQTVIKIPYMKFDTPLYDITHAMMYVIRKLKENGFKIANIHENGLHVMWNQ